MTATSKIERTRRTRQETQFNEAQQKSIADLYSQMMPRPDENLQCK